MDSVNNILIKRNVAAVNSLKLKAIDQYKDLLNRLKKGYKDDYSDLMNLICFINLPIKLDNHEFIKQFLNNGANNIHFSTKCGCSKL